jgi:NADH:ubiquinone oxidoreductase subunit C
MNDTELQTKITERWGTRANLSAARERRLFVSVALADVKPVMKWLRDELGFYHLSTITGLDSGANWELLYHLHDGRAELTLRTAFPKAADGARPHIPTTTDIIPGAILYERELQDMFGFVVDGIPDPRRYVLPEDWPVDVYPLRKDYKYNAGN